jgi:hypothetical protein
VKLKSTLPAVRARKMKSDRAWVSTYQDGAKYFRERMKALIKSVQAGQAIDVTVTHPLDAKVYDGE